MIVCQDLSYVLLENLGCTIRVEKLFLSEKYKHVKGLSRDEISKLTGQAGHLIHKSVRDQIVD